MALAVSIAQHIRYAAEWRALYAALPRTARVRITAVVVRRVINP